MSNPLVSQSQVVERLESQPWGAEQGEVQSQPGIPEILPPDRPLKQERFPIVGDAENREHCPLLVEK